MGIIIFMLRVSYQCHKREETCWGLEVELETICINFMTSLRSRGRFDHHSTGQTSSEHLTNTVSGKAITFLKKEKSKVQNKEKFVMKREDSEEQQTSGNNIL